MILRKLQDHWPLQQPNPILQINAQMAKPWKNHARHDKIVTTQLLASDLSEFQRNREGFYNWTPRSIVCHTKMSENDLKCNLSTRNLAWKKLCQSAPRGICSLVMSAVADVTGEAQRCASGCWIHLWVPKFGETRETPFFNGWQSTYQHAVQCSMLCSR